MRTVESFQNNYYIHIFYSGVKYRFMSTGDSLTSGGPWDSLLVYIFNNIQLLLKHMLPNDYAAHRIIFQTLTNEKHPNIVMYNNYY